MTARGPSSYGLGAGPQFGSPAPVEEPTALDSIRKQTSKIEDFLDSVSGPIKPYVPPELNSIVDSPPPPRFPDTRRKLLLRDSGLAG